MTPPTDAEQREVIAQVEGEGSRDEQGSPAMREELKGCPFCGGKAARREHAHVTSSGLRSAPTHSVKCEDCHAGSWEMALPEFAIAAWNNRSPDKALLDEVERLKTAHTEIVAHCAMSRDEFVLQGPAFACRQVERAVAIARAALSPTLEDVGGNHE